MKCMATMLKQCTLLTLDTHSQQWLYSGGLECFWSCLIPPRFPFLF